MGHSQYLLCLPFWASWQWKLSVWDSNGIDQHNPLKSTGLYFKPLVLRVLASFIYWAYTRLQIKTALTMDPQSCSGSKTANILPLKQSEEAHFPHSVLTAFGEQRVPHRGQPWSTASWTWIWPLCCPSQGSAFPPPIPLWKGVFSPDCGHVLCCWVPVCFILNTSKQKAWCRWHTNVRGRGQTVGLIMADTTEGLCPHS